jgi:hypothetical protein
LTWLAVPNRLAALQVSAAPWKLEPHASVHAILMPIPFV